MNTPKRTKKQTRKEFVKDNWFKYLVKTTGYKKWKDDYRKEILKNEYDE